MATMTAQDFDAIKESVQGGSKNWIKVGMSTCGIAAGASNTTVLGNFIGTDSTGTVNLKMVSIISIFFSSL